MTQVHCIISNKDFVAEGDLAYIEQLYKGSQIKILDKKWLDVGAVELILDRFPQEYIDDGYLSLQLDINFIDAEHHNMDKKVLLADMDSTIINVESIDELADYNGFRSEVSMITEKAMQGIIDFDQALVARVNLLKGLSISKAVECFNDRVDLSPGADILVKTLRRRGVYCVMVSGGFTLLADKIGSLLDFNEVFANKLVTKDGILTGEVDQPVINAKKKLEILEQICFQRGATTQEAVAVGDGANDVEVIKAAGVGVSYFGKRIVQENANISIRYSDLKTVLYCLGISKTEFADFC